MKTKKYSSLNATKGILKLPSVAFFLFQNIAIQKKFIKNQLLPELIFFEENNDGSLKKEDFKKITNYYALGVPAILGYAFSVLRGFPLKSNERNSLTYLGGISGLLDDLFDEKDKKVMHLETFIFHPEALEPLNNYEALLKQCYLKGLKASENAEDLKKQAAEVFKTEIESESQQHKNLSEEKIKELTFLKGGHSFLFYRLCLSNPLKEREREMIFQLGGLMQLGNDIFDVWEDVNEEIETLATKTRTIAHLRNFFSAELNKCFELLLKCHFPAEQLQDFTRILLFGLSRVFVCLDQFEKLQASKTSIFQPETYTRKQLICDMELFRNQKAALKYYLKLHAEYL